MKQHHLCNHPLYTVWDSMKQRCYNPNNDSYPYCGANGIKVNPIWKKSFRAFYNWAMTNGWKSGLQIDRKKNDGNYSPSNCRIVTPRKNILNKKWIPKGKVSFLGVHIQPNTEKNKYIAQIKIKGKSIHIGSYLTAEEAVKA